VTRKTNFLKFLVNLFKLPTNNSEICSREIVGNDKKNVISGARINRIYYTRINKIYIKARQVLEIHCKYL